MDSSAPPRTVHRHERLEDRPPPGDVHDRFARWPDARLVRAAPSHATGAWHELFRRHGPSVRAAASSVLGSSPECEDVVAEVFAALWRRPDRFDANRGPLVGYLRMQARSASIDWLRAEGRRRAREANDGRRRPVEEVSIEAGLLVAEAAEELWRAVARLPSGERRAIELAYRRGLSYRAVADQLGLPEGTVKTRIRSGIQRLRDTGDAPDQSAGLVGGVLGAHEH
jgi:RNA polymerase sigma-70 factor (ECF subfamily)